MQLPDRPISASPDQARTSYVAARLPWPPPNSNSPRLRLSSWPKLKQHVESLEQAGELRQAISRHDSNA